MNNAKIDKRLEVASAGRTPAKPAVFVTRVAVMSGMLTALKLALSYLPNVEVVTLLILVYAAVWGAGYAVTATVVFSCVEVALYGVGSWVLLYFLYWPCLALVSSFLLKNGKLWIAVLVSVVGGVLFGVLSACTDTLFVIGYAPYEELGKYWVAYYVRGLYFDLVHVIASTAFVLALFKPFYAVSKRLAKEGRFTSPV